MFDPEKFQAGVPAIDRDGNLWRFSRKTLSPTYPLEAKGPRGRIETFTDGGLVFHKLESPNDLVGMAEAEQVGASRNPRDVFEEAFTTGRKLRRIGGEREYTLALLTEHQAVLADRNGMLAARSRNFADRWELVSEFEEMTFFLNVYSDGTAASHSVEENARKLACTHARAVAVPVTVKLPRE